MKTMIEHTDYRDRNQAIENNTTASTAKLSSGEPGVVIFLDKFTTFFHNDAAIALANNIIDAIDSQETK